MGRRLHAPSCLTRPPRSPGPGSAPRRCAASRLAGTTTVERGAIASEAIQSPATTLDCFVAALLAMTVVKHAFSSSHPLSRPSVAHLIALSRMRARGRPGAGRHPWPACSRKSRRQSPQVRAGSSGLPRAMVGTAYTCSPRGPAVLPPSPARSSRLATPAWSQHRETRTTRFRRAHRIVRRHDRSRCNPTRPPHPAPHARDDRDAPLK